MNRTSERALDVLDREPAPDAPADGSNATDSETAIATRPIAGRVGAAFVVMAVLVVMAGPAVFVAVRATRGAASFADTQQVGINELSAALIDIEIGERTVPILGNVMAPGDTRLGSIEFANRGTVDLRYSVGSAAIGADASRIVEHMTWTAFWAADGASCPTRPPGDAVVVGGAEMADGVMLMGDRAFGTDPGDRILRVGQAELLCLAVSLAVDVPNSLQSQSITQPVVAFAEQLTDTSEGES